MKTLLILSCVIAIVFGGVAQAAQKKQTAIFAGGCFWCMEAPFEKLDGVLDVVSGYAGGTGKNPTYKTYGSMGYVEVIKVVYDPSIISYQKLLDVFWRQIDPTDAGGQFVDRGSEYRSAIFYVNDSQKLQAEKSKEALARSGRFNRPIVTEIVKAGVFYPAEDYHQDYYKKSKLKYWYYRKRSGRDEFLEKAWGQ